MITALELLKRQYIGQTIITFAVNGYRTIVDKSNFDIVSTALSNGRGKLHAIEVIDVIYSTNVYSQGKLLDDNVPHFEFVLKNEPNLGFGVH